MDFKADIQGKALENHVFKTELANDDFQCKTLCFLDDHCISYNFGMSRDNKRSMCELSDSDHVMHPEDLVDRLNTTYKNAENNCNCSKHAICRFNFAKGTHRCQCKPGFTGSLCENLINECASNPCQHGGTCQDKINSYNCTCAAGFTGVNCETNINDCASTPCQNGGSCQDQVNSYTCTCAAGFTGVNCQIDIDECASNPCQNGGSCQDQVNSYNCTCAVGFTGVNCQSDIDECASTPCQNGGSCQDQVNSFTCICAAGFTGIECQTDIDDCVGFPCMHGGTCHDLINAYNCTCVVGYVGPNCETNIDECASNPCQNGGICQDQVNSYTCTCVAGYTGVNCQTDIDECASNPCQHGGTCQDQVSSYNCTCAAGFTGVNCQTDIDECASNPCQNGGTCQDQVDSYNCTCAAGFTGVNCQTEWLDTFPLTTCVGAKDDHFGKVVVPLEGYVKAMKLVYESGDGLSYRGGLNKGYWGGTQYASTIQIFITNTTNHILAPQNVTISKSILLMMAYNLPNITNMDPVLMFPYFVSPFFVQKHQSLRVWFGPDLVNYAEFANYGTTCAQVKMMYLKSPS